MPRTYHPALIVLHWLLAVMILGALFAGTAVLAPLPNDDPAKLVSFRMHMGLGIAILVLMVVRLAVRLRTPRPPRAITGIALFDLLAPLVHWGLYATVIAMALAGVAISVSSGLGAAVWGSGPMPADFEGNSARLVHGLLAKVLMGLIGLHILGALLHGAIKGEGVMSRMWFGGR